jgi:hypothetical protein
MGKMDTRVEILIGIAAVTVAVLFAYAIYRMRQRRRVHRVEMRVKEYLCGRFGDLPASLHIDCSDDRLWPVLVDFANPRTGVRHRLQFHCPGAGSSLALLSDKEEKCPMVEGN